MAIKILLADDSLTIQKVVELTFSDAETRLMAVGSGDQAVQALDDFAPDIVLADVVMPGLTGYDVCEAVKTASGRGVRPRRPPDRDVRAVRPGARRARRERRDRHEAVRLARPCRASSASSSGRPAAPARRPKPRRLPHRRRRPRLRRP